MEDERCKNESIDRVLKPTAWIAQYCILPTIMENVLSGRHEPQQVVEISLVLNALDFVGLKQKC
jgi:hypothetical protein